MSLAMFKTGVAIYSNKRGDKMEITNIIMLWLHYLATVMWIGGMAFNLLVLRPSMVAIDQNQRPVLGTTVLRRFIVFAWLPRFWHFVLFMIYAAFRKEVSHPFISNSSNFSFFALQIGQRSGGSSLAQR